MDLPLEPAQPGATGWSSLQSPLLTLRGDPSMGPGPWFLWDALQASHSHPFVHYYHLLSLAALKFMLWFKWTEHIFHSSLQAKSIYKTFYKTCLSFPRPVLFVFQGA